MLFLTCITLLYFLLSNTKDDILKNVGNQAVLVNIDYHYMDKKKHLFFFFSKYVLSCSTEESHTGMEQRE